MLKEKVFIKYDIIGNKGFSFNSSTYNILSKNNTFWATSTKMDYGEIEVRFPPHIITHIEFSNLFFFILF